MSSIKQAVSRTALSFAEALIPVLKTSKFRETGVITPEEYVAAGDFLVHHCPTWKWLTGDEKKLRPYLPAEKQYLCTKNVPCHKRVKQVDSHNEEYEKLIEVNDDSGGWIDTHYFAKTAKMDKVVDIEKLKNDGNNCAISEEDDDGPAMDMEDFIQSGMLDNDDPAAVSSRVIEKISNLEINSESELVQTRTYDLYISYDKYYQTPRLWLHGYGENREDLSELEMFEDFSQDHANKTVTMESFPHLTGVSMPSLHPCKQADVMKKLIAAVSHSGTQLEVYQYLMVFLKFVSAVIPTIEYDYTRNFNMGAPN